jgi:hypothetical protein
MAVLPHVSCYPGGATPRTPRCASRRVVGLAVVSRGRRDLRSLAGRAISELRSSGGDPGHSRCAFGALSVRAGVPSGLALDTSLRILYNKFFQGVFRLTMDFWHLVVECKSPPRPSCPQPPRQRRNMRFARRQPARDGDCGWLPPARGQERSTIIGQPARRGRNETFVGFEQAAMVIVCSYLPSGGG